MKSHVFLGIYAASLAAVAMACSAPNRSLASEDAGPVASSRLESVPNQVAASVAVPAGEPPPFHLLASIRELMDSEVDPAADFLWGSVASISTRAGLEERQPRTDDEWLEVRRHAVTLSEAPNLLIMKGRRVSATYVPSAGAGELDSNDVQKKIDENPQAFVALAQNLQDAAVKTLAAVDAKDPVALFELGGTIDEACEACHVTFWYPNQVLPYK
jgi:Cytochrome C'